MIILISLFFVLGIRFHQARIQGLPTAISLVLASTLNLVILSWSFILCLWLSFDFKIALIILVFFYGYLVKKYATFKLTSLKIPSTMSLLACAILGLAAIFYQKSSIPWGGWDAVAIWNQHAKFLSAGPQWIAMFDPALSSSHPDYPLFLPSLIAIAWQAFPGLSNAVPMILGLFPLLGILTILFFSLPQKAIGIIPCVILLVDKAFIDQAASQYADTWLAFFILMGLYLLVELPKNKHLAWVIGLIMANCCWIKNEGFIFFILAGAITVYYLFPHKKNLLVFMASAGILLLLILFYKIHWTPANDMAAEMKGSIWPKLKSQERYFTLFDFAKKSMLGEYQMLIPLALIGLFIVKSFPKSLLLPSLVIILLFLAYMGIYLITPKDLSWHLSTSFFRLIHHLYPSILFLYFCLMDQHKKYLI